jgi:regulatory protein
LPANPPRPAPFLDEAGLYAYAVKALGRQMRTEAELRRLMKARVEPGERGDALVAATAARLKEHGYLDDASFAETYARLRQQNEKLGPEPRAARTWPTRACLMPSPPRPSRPATAGTSEESLARQHLERKRIRKPENEKETDPHHAPPRRRRLLHRCQSTEILRQWNIPEEALAAPRKH